MLINFVDQTNVVNHYTTPPTKQDLDPISHFCTAQPRGGDTDSDDGQTADFGHTN